MAEGGEKKGWPQDFLDWLYYRREWLMTELACLSLWTFGTEISKEDVANSRYGQREHQDLSFEKADNIDLVLNEAKESFNEAQERNDRVLDKSKTLLTLASLLVALVGAFLIKVPSLPTWIRVVFFLSMFCLLNAVFLVCFILDVRSKMCVTIDQEEADLAPELLKTRLANSYRKSVTTQENLTDGLVDLYRAARFFFLIALTLMLFEFVASYFLVNPETLASETATALRADATFMSSIRGEKGDVGQQGPAGPKGDPGPQGDQGPKGDRGDSSSRANTVPHS